MCPHPCGHERVSACLCPFFLHFWHTVHISSAARFISFQRLGPAIRAAQSTARLPICTQSPRMSIIHPTNSSERMGLSCSFAAGAHFQGDEITAQCFEAAPRIVCLNVPIPNCASICSHHSSTPLGIPGRRRKLMRLPLEWGNHEPFKSPRHVFGKGPCRHTPAMLYNLEHDKPVDLHAVELARRCRHPVLSSRRHRLVCGVMTTQRPVRRTPFQS